MGLGTRYTIAHLMMITLVIAVFSMGILHESPWWRASLMTFCLCAFLNSIIAAIVCRKEKQAFALGYAVSSFFYLLSLYASFGVETLPMLITQNVYAYILEYSASPPSDTHFFIVAGMFWAVSFGYGGATLASHWYRQRMKIESKELEHGSEPAIAT